MNKNLLRFGWLVICLLQVSFYAFSQSVDPMTGRLQMSLPVGQLQANDVSVPISIYHHGGSLRVAEGEGDCGMGWNLSAGGSVSRIVRGLPDEIDMPNRKGWLRNGNAQAIQNFTPTADDNLLNCTDEVSDWNFLNTQVGGYVNDPEPDLFFVNAPGLSAQFVFAPDGTPRLLNYQDLKIEYVINNQAFATGQGIFSSFTVRKNNGMVYVFDHDNGFDRVGVVRDEPGKEYNLYDLNTTARYYRADSPYFIPATSVGVKWYLTAITSTITGTTATFKYKSVKAGTSHSYMAMDSTKSNYMRDTYLRKELDTIQLKSYTAVFKWANDGILQSVIVNESSTGDRKEVRFEYESVTAEANRGNNHGVAKAFLYKVRQFNGVCEPSETYTFEYEGVIFDKNSSLYRQAPAYIDWKKNWGQDYFGYPNGIAGNKNTPTLYYYENESNERRLRTMPIPGLTSTKTTKIASSATRVSWIWLTLI